MKRILITALLTLVTAFGFVSSLGLAQPSTVFALTANQEAVCKSIGAGADCDKNTSGGTSVNSVIKTVIGIMSTLVGVLAVIMIIVSGFKYVTAAGDSNKISSAKNTLIYAIVGLLIVALAQTIVKFVLRNVTGN